MRQVELTSKLVLAIIGLASVSAILIPTYAAPSIKSADIVDGQVKTADLADNAITTAKIANGQVQIEDLAGGAVKPNVKVVEGHSVTVDAGESGFAEAHCPNGYTLTGGGYNAGSVIDVNISHPQHVEEGGFTNTWIASGFNGDDVGSSFLTAFAVCMGPSP